MSVGGVRSTQVLESEKKRAHRAEALEQGAVRSGGAHVVAPCPHDGACPMDGTTSWCHFLQRFERTHLQRMTKVGPCPELPRAAGAERKTFFGG